MREAARLLGGIGPTALSKLVRRHRLNATGHGKARRCPRATVDALRELKSRRGRSTGTSNHYLSAVRQFARWLAENGRIDRSPFTRLNPLNARLDTRRRRGELTPLEVSRLLTTAATNRSTFRALSGPARAMLYRVALGTGFRASERAALVPRFFDLDAPPPAVVLPAEFTKNRNGAVQPLAADLAADLRDYLRNRSEKEPVWPGTWHKKAAEMMGADLEAANVPLEVGGSDGRETRDFHALRASYISNVIRAGADLKHAMTLARIRTRS